MSEQTITKEALLATLDAVWDALYGEVMRMTPAQLDSRMPLDSPAWNGRQLLGHLIGAIHADPYYLAQGQSGGVIEGVIGDPYWRQIYATATLHSFRVMLAAAFQGTRAILAGTDEADLGGLVTFTNGNQGRAVDLLHFNYDVHLRSHIGDLQRWNDSVNNP